MLNIFFRISQLRSDQITEEIHNQTSSKKLLRECFIQENKTYLRLVQVIIFSSDSLMVWSVRGSIAEHLHRKTPQNYTKLNRNTEITWQKRKKKQLHLAWKHATAFPNKDRKGQNNYLMNLNMLERRYVVGGWGGLLFFFLTSRTHSLCLSPTIHKLSCFFKKVNTLALQVEQKKIQP